MGPIPADLMNALARNIVDARYLRIGPAQLIAQSDNFGIALIHLFCSRSLLCHIAPSLHHNIANVKRYIGHRQMLDSTANMVYASVKEPIWTRGGANP